MYLINTKRQDCKTNLHSFLLFITEHANTEVKTFPMIFNNGEFIGGFAETKEYIEKKCLSFEENDNFK